MATSQGQISDIMVTISPEIDSIQHVDLVLEEILIDKLPPKKIKKFKDPFKYIPDKTEGEESQATPVQEDPT